MCSPSILLSKSLSDLVIKKEEEEYEEEKIAPFKDRFPVLAEWRELLETPRSTDPSEIEESVLFLGLFYIHLCLFRNRTKIGQLFQLLLDTVADHTIWSYSLSCGGPVSSDDNELRTVQYVPFCCIDGPSC